MRLTDDALIFGMAYLSSEMATLAFGGEGAEMEITNRARDALDNLILMGFAQESEPTDQIPGREFYRGKDNLFAIAKARGINPLDLLSDHGSWPAFVKKETP